MKTLVKKNPAVKKYSIVSCPDIPMQVVCKIGNIEICISKYMPNFDNEEDVKLQQLETTIAAYILWPDAQIAIMWGEYWNMINMVNNINWNKIDKLGEWTWDKYSNMLRQVGEL